MAEEVRGKGSADAGPGSPKSDFLASGSPIENLFSEVDGALKEGKLSDGEVRFIDILRADPTNASATLILSAAVARLGRFEPAIQAVGRVLDKEPASRQALSLMASLLWRTGKPKDAAECYERIVSLNPRDPAAYNSLGLCYLAAGESTEALLSFEKAVQLDSKVAAFHQNMAKALEHQSRLEEAIRAYKSAIKLSANPADSEGHLGDLLINHGFEGAADCFRNAHQLEPETARGQINLAKAVYFGEGDAHRSADILLTLINCDATHANAFALLGLIQQQQGQFEDSRTSLEIAMAIDPKKALPYSDYVKGKRITQDDKALVAAMVAMEGEVERTPSDRRILNFALGKAYNDLGDYQKAMTHYHQANLLSGRIDRRVFDRVQLAKRVDALVSLFTREFFESHRDLGSDSELPLFVVGMFRSGTTLVEQILSCHPEVAGGGELSFWPIRANEAYNAASTAIVPEKARMLADEYVKGICITGPEAQRVTDKHPENIFSVGLLHLLYPKARFIHCRRHPVDNCLSLYMTYFSSRVPYDSDPDDIVFFYQQYARMMDHWKSVLPPDHFLEVQYEDLIRETEQISRQMVEFSGLPWHDACIHPELNGRIVRTASQWQVRQPIYRSSLERWRQYEPWLGAFKKLLVE